MTSQRRRLAALLLPLPLAACGPATDEPGPVGGPGVELTFGVSRIAVFPAFSVQRIDARGVLVRGTFSTPCSPYGAVAVPSLAADTVVVRVEGRMPPGCRDAVGTVAYDARLSALPAGRFVLRVVHRGEAGAPGDRDAFVTNVTPD
jgi:hypothetical protein